MVQLSVYDRSSKDPEQVSNFDSISSSARCSIVLYGYVILEGGTHQLPSDK